MSRQQYFVENMNRDGTGSRQYFDEIGDAVEYFEYSIRENPNMKIGKRNPDDEEVAINPDYLDFLLAQDSV